MSGTSTSSNRWRDLAQVVFFVLIVRPFMTLFIGLRVRGREHLAVSGPFVLVANHSSHLDTVALLSLFPLRRLVDIRPCAAADVFERTRTRAFWSQLLFHVLPIERADIRPEDHPLDRMAAALVRGESLILFPEGTRGVGGDMGPFKSGVARLAERIPGLTFIPAYLCNIGRALPKGEFLPVPFFCEIRIGEPMRLTGEKDAMLESLRLRMETLRET
jgi:1-acyl-sn-glycerol-3-phosphate acyltransferase